MQTIWSRAARTPSSCRCTSCLSAATAISRRATTATTRRRLKVGDAFTAFYSAIFATAAVVDAKIKDDRRNDLDRMIEETRSDLRVIGEAAIRTRDMSGNNSRAKISADGITVPDNQYRNSRRHRGQGNWACILERMELYSDQTRVIAEQQLSENCPSEAPGGCLAREVRATDAISGGGLSKNNSLTPEGRECATEYRSTFNDARIDTVTGSKSRRECGPSEKKLGELEHSIRKLVTRLLQHSIDQHENEEDLRELKKCLILLQNNPDQLSEPTPGCLRYPRYICQEQTSHKAERQLNQSIRKIFHRSTKGYIHLSAVIPKICYNLLTSTTPPNAETYNILITYLARLRWNALVRVVVDSMLEIGQTPNHTTTSSLIKFYTASNDPDGFLRLVRLMRGLDGGLFYGAWSLSSFPDSEWVNKRKAQAVWEGRDRMLSDKVPCNVFTFGAAINAALKFGMIKRAQLWYRAMVREGYNPTPPVLTSIIRSCAFRREWLSGWKTWLKLKEVWELEASPEGYPWVAYSWMLKLCRWCDRRTEFEDIFKEAVQKGLYPLGLPMNTKTKGLPIANKDKSPRTEGIRCAYIRRDQSRQSGLSLSHDEAWNNLKPLYKPCPPISSGTWHTVYEGFDSDFDD